mmetsp:Transcript_29699/g.41404  ORF Transcript_29699/g.41404 Transcript_29699/m.41404 type:complete len:108 (-) Transcript_29699:962-1285(-)
MYILVLQGGGRRQVLLYRPVVVGVRFIYSEEMLAFDGLSLAMSLSPGILHDYLPSLQYPSTLLDNATEFVTATAAVLRHCFLPEGRSSVLVREVERKRHCCDLASSK